MTVSPPLAILAPMPPGALASFNLLSPLFKLHVAWLVPLVSVTVAGAERMTTA